MTGRSWTCAACGYLVDTPNHELGCPEGRREAPDQRRVFHVYELPEMTKAVRLHDLRLPIHIALGRYEAATQEELHDLITDLTAELTRRSETGAA